MAEADDEAITPTTVFEPLGSALKESFEKQREELPPGLRELVDKWFPVLNSWNMLSPDRRRRVVWQRDIDRHPDLSHENYMLWKKSMEIDECVRTASKVPYENREWRDVKDQAIELRKLRAEETALERALLKKAESLGLHR